MVNALGYYLTRAGETVQITRLLEHQPIAEGYILKGGAKDTYHIWYRDGTANRFKQTERDLVLFMYFSDPDESCDE